MRSTRRYMDEEKPQAARLVRHLRAETGSRHGSRNGSGTGDRHLSVYEPWDNLPWTRWESDLLLSSVVWPGSLVEVRRMSD